MPVSSPVPFDENLNVARIVRFLAAGIAAVAVNLAVFGFCLIAGMNVSVAAVVAYAAAFAVNFALNRNWTFGARGLEGLGGHLVKFLVVSACYLAINVVLIEWLVGLDVRPLIAQAIILVCLAPLTFIALRGWAFRSTD